MLSFDTIIQSHKGKQKQINTNAMKKMILEYVVSMLEREEVSEPKRKYVRKGIPVYCMGELAGYVARPV